MKRSLNILLLICLSVVTVTAHPGRSVENINKNWRFHKGDVKKGHLRDLDDSDWQQVTLPHTWNVDDHFDHRHADDGLDITLAYYRGPGWYRRIIELPEQDRARRIFLKFEGANQVTDLYVNEEHVGSHIGGYTNFEFDVTNQVKFGAQNLISVRVDNAYDFDIPPISADYTMYGGIYRDVWLVKTSPVFVQQALISTPEVSAKSAQVSAEVKVRNQSGGAFTGEIAVTFVDPEGVQLAVQNKEIQLPAASTSIVTIAAPDFGNPRLWSPATPDRYSARIALLENNTVIDGITERFGLRWFRFDSNDGFFLNGSHLRLRGVNRHQDRAGFGNALSDDQHREDMRLIKSTGANFVRLAHYPQDPSVLDACDSLGILVWEEIPLVRSVGREKFADNSRNMLREMVTQHYNHPSIIIWGLMNEVMRDQRDSELHWAVDLCKDLNRLAKKLDPKRYTAQAQYKDRGTDILTVTDIIGFNKYYGWYSDKFDYFGEYMDVQKRLYPDKVFIISEYGAGSKRGFHVEHPGAPDFSETWQLDLHQSYWQQISERKYIAGSAIWNMFDFASDEKGGNIPHINQKGLMTFDRRPKDVYYYYQSLWTKEPMVYIVSHTWRKRKGKPGEPKEVEVLSNCGQVELFLNGENQGSKSAPFIWQVKFSKGSNDLRVVAHQGRMQVEDRTSVTYVTEQ